MLILFVVVAKYLANYLFLAFSFAWLLRVGLKPSAWHPTMWKNYLVMDRIVSGRWQEDYPKPAKERLIVRSVINQTNPDILAIQEIGERVYLDELWKDLNNTNGVQFKYSAWLPGLGEGEKRHLALLSKFPFKLVPSTADLSFKYFEVRRFQVGACSKPNLKPMDKNGLCSIYI